LRFEQAESKFYMAVRRGPVDQAMIKPARFLMVWIRLNGASTDVFGFDGRVIDRIVDGH